MELRSDFLIIGSGIAALRAVPEVASHGDVLILTKAGPEEGNTGHAQGLTRITVYVQNPTSNTRSFLYKMGGDDWKTYTIYSGHTLTMTGIAPHYIRYDNAHHRTIQYKLTPGSTVYFSWSRGFLSVRHR